MSSSTSPANPHPILPPIVKSERDKIFLTELQDFIARETGRTDPNNKKQWFLIYKAAFEKIIDYVRAYKPLLTAIKASYEEIIEAIERGQQEASYLGAKLQTMASEPSTMHQYRRRVDELQRKIDIVRADNERLAAKLRQMKESRSKRHEEAKRALEPNKREVKKDSRAIPGRQSDGPKFVPGLSLEESTNLQVLQKELVRVEAQMKELSNSKRSRFAERKAKDDLKEKLAKKVEERDLLYQRNNWLNARQKRLRVAHDAVQTYSKAQPQYKTLGDVVIIAMAKNKVGSDEKVANRDASELHEEDDPTKEKEAEMILEYIEKFNELFEEGAYEEAAIHAANSPKGILRTMETMNRFKAVEAKESGRSPWLAFCDAIMSSVLALGVKPSDAMSMECVRCAIKENRLDLLAHWLSQDRLTVTEVLGDMISEHVQGSNRNYLSLAENIYLRCMSHKKVVACMVRQGRCRRAVEYSREKAFLTVDEYAELLKTYPSEQLANALTERTASTGDKSLLPVGVAVRMMIEADHFDTGLHLLQELHNQGVVDPSTVSPLRQAVFDDSLTSQQQWMDIVKCCHDYGYEDVSVELLTAIAVQKALKWNQGAGALNLGTPSADLRENSNLSGKSSSADLNFSSGTNSSLQD